MSTFDEFHVDDLQSKLFTWISSRLRQFPWRDVRDPWHILVSEVMLQQTSVHRVLGKWESFVVEFPTPQACAGAELGDLLRMWQGLGYPRRARNLHAASRLIVSDHDGRVPNSLEALLSLPGVGPYTARAVLAFAFEDDAAVVDVNIARVLRRLVGERISARSAQELADRLLPSGESWLWNQAMMDLGATVCRSRPECSACPVQTSCRWRGDGADPAARPSGAMHTSFEGSARQARGRLMKALVSGPVDIDAVSSVMGRPPHVALELVHDLVDEGLIQRFGSRLVL